MFLITSQNYLEPIISGNLFTTLKFQELRSFSPSSLNYTGPLTRTSTMESADLDALLRREQYFVVPSYSQAMLVTPSAANVVRKMRIRI